MLQEAHEATNGGISVSSGLDGSRNGLWAQLSWFGRVEQGSETDWLFWLGAAESSATEVLSGNRAETSAQTRKTNSASRTTIIAPRDQIFLSAIAGSGTLLILNPFNIEYERDCDWLTSRSAIGRWMSLTVPIPGDSVDEEVHRVTLHRLTNCGKA